jgi:hypothetical protein
VAASGAGTTDVMLWLSPSDGEPDKPVAIRHDLWMLSSFADWLSKHGSLGRSIALHGFKETIIVTACQMLGMALKLAASGPRSLKLQSFISDVTSSEHASMPLLAALPNCLTELQITADECITQTFEHAHGCTVLSHAVYRLKHLRTLCIREGVSERSFLHPQALAELCNLTCLELEWAQFTHVSAAADVACLQSRSEHLTILQVCLGMLLAPDSLFVAVVVRDSHYSLSSLTPQTRFGSHAFPSVALESPGGYVNAGVCAGGVTGVCPGPVQHAAPTAADSQCAVPALRQ